MFFISVAHPLACPAVGKFSRASSAGPPTVLATKFRKSDRVGRRGLFEPREDFSRLLTCAIPWLNSVADSVAVSVVVSVAHPFACPAVGKFSRASSAGGRRYLQQNFANRIVSVAEDCLSPERTFHGCTLVQFRGSIPWLYPWLSQSLIVSQCNDRIFAARNNRGIHPEDQSNRRRNSKADNN